MVGGSPVAAHLAPASRPSADKIKAFHALLLSLAVIAGAVTITTDAYAQTNTERLITVVDNTNEANSLLSDILDAVTSGFANVLEMLGVIDTDLAAIHGDLEDIHGDLSAVDTDLQEIHGDLEDIHGDLAALDGDMQTLSASISGLGAASAALGEVSQGVQTNAASINALNAKLDMISDAVGVVSNTTTSIQVAVEEDDGPAADTAIGGKLIRDTSEVEVTIGDFIAGVKKHPADNIYTADATFSCDGDVFVTAVKSTNEHPVLGDKDGAVDQSGESLDVSTIKVDGQIIFATDYDADGSGGATPNDFEIFKRDITYNPGTLLLAGSTIKIVGSTDQSMTIITFSNGTSGDTGLVTTSIKDVRDAEKRSSIIGNITDQGRSTKADAVKVALYELEVDWFTSASGVSCGISTATTTGTGDLDNTDNQLVFAIAFKDPDSSAVISELATATIDCNGEAAQITKVENAAGGDLLAHTKLTLSGGDKDGIVNFDATGNSIADGDKSSDLPYEFGDTMTITGMSPDPVLLRVTYDTVTDNECSVQ